MSISGSGAAPDDLHPEGDTLGTPLNPAEEALSADLTSISSSMAPSLLSRYDRAGDVRRAVDRMLSKSSPITGTDVRALVKVAADFDQITAAEREALEGLVRDHADRFVPGALQGMADFLGVANPKLKRTEIPELTLDRVTVASTGGARQSGVAFRLKVPNAPFEQFEFHFTRGSLQISTPDDPGLFQRVHEAGAARAALAELRRNLEQAPAGGNAPRKALDQALALLGRMEKQLAVQLAPIDKINAFSPEAKLATDTYAALVAGKLTKEQAKAAAAEIRAASDGLNARRYVLNPEELKSVSYSLETVERYLKFWALNGTLRRT